MSRAEQPSGRFVRSLARRRTLRLGMLVGVLAGLTVYLVLGTGRTGNGVSVRACAGFGAPEVRLVKAPALTPLREAVRRVLPQRVGRLYEEGTVSGSDAWWDGNPAPPPISPTMSQPAGYEMRWWAPNNDDVVADVFVFSSPASAARFLEQASNGRCRVAGRRVGAARPPQARNVAWTNPDGVTEADVYLERGARVYRVADVPAGQHGGSAAGVDLSRAFLTIDTLACLLPQAHCEGASRSVPA